MSSVILSKKATCSYRLSAITIKQPTLKSQAYGRNKSKRESRRGTACSCIHNNLASTSTKHQYHSSAPAENISRNLRHINARVIRLRGGRYGENENAGACVALKITGSFLLIIILYIFFSQHLCMHVCVTYHVRILEMKPSSKYHIESGPGTCSGRRMWGGVAQFLS